MKVLQWVEISIYILATIIHIVALTMLVRMSKHAMKGSQKFLFMSLSMTELSYCLFSFIRFFCIELGVKKSIYQHVSIFQSNTFNLLFHHDLHNFGKICCNLFEFKIWSLLVSQENKALDIFHFSLLHCCIYLSLSDMA